MENDSIVPHYNCTRVANIQTTHKVNINSGHTIDNLNDTKLGLNDEGNISNTADPEKILPNPAQVILMKDNSVISVPEVDRKASVTVSNHELSQNDDKCADMNKESNANSNTDNVSERSWNNQTFFNEFLSSENGQNNYYNTGINTPNVAFNSINNEVISDNAVELSSLESNVSIISNSDNSLQPFIKEKSSSQIYRANSISSLENNDISNNFGDQNRKENFDEDFNITTKEKSTAVSLSISLFQFLFL